MRAQVGKRGLGVCSGDVDGKHVGVAQNELSEIGPQVVVQVSIYQGSILGTYV